ncbi:MAG: AI-2E family transporter [candidate division WOR-3 bacterium]|nr:AI-2E family transporter [candidate division WOR-3 bacterium]
MEQIIVYIAIVILIIFVFISRVFSPVGLLLLTLIILWPQRKKGVARTLFFISILFLVLFVIIRYFSILMPFIIGAGIAYIIAPIVDTFEKRKIPRVVAILIVLLPLMAIIPSVLFLLTINLINELKFLTAKIPDFITQSRILFDVLIKRLNMIGFNITQEIVMNAINNYLGTLLNGILQTVLRLGQGMKGLLLLLYNYILIPIITYLLLLDREKIKAWIENLLPGEEKESFNSLLKKLNVSLSRYFRGQLLMTIIVGFLIGFSLWLVGVRYYVFLGIISALCNLIPNVGFIISFIPALLIGMLTPPSSITIIKIISVYVGEQILENLLLGPLIIGKVSRLHPVVVMLALILCGGAGGFWGLLLAIPIIIFIRESLNHFLGLKL